MRRPSLQFYPGDWQSNPKLRRCSHAEKGVWLDVLCILHDQDEYGIVRWPLRELAVAVHCKLSALKKLVDKKVLKGVESGLCEPFVFVPRHGRKDGIPATLIEAQEGPIWFSSRMVRDEYVRSHAGAATRFGSPERERKDDKLDTLPSERGAPGQWRGAGQGDGSSSSISSSSSTSSPGNSTHTHEPLRAGVCVKSKFSLEQNLQYAKASCQTDNGIKQPDAWAAANYASGLYDEMVEKFFQNPDKHFRKAVVW